MRNWRLGVKFEIPEPLQIDWIKKPVENAVSGVEVLKDGRVFCWIKHEIVRGVTPKMLVWWFKHLEGTVTIDGVAHNRYRVWRRSRSDSPLRAAAAPSFPSSTRI